ncbi:MAG: YdeI/OmpD-associated family protein [Myxococcales bacterium]|nr:YdeI/OmpD-associated family protein [Myxococcales bacterium]MCB9521371.1 YdeI/OmpD-associated family protein [Myxococcales bacterium]MCB9532544.1 YdeI/OmpD-associated family protein [Myxococcales bacterium]MCB9533782.1 YdeI/OmpD-associated family protein [Myxococcales bacterium]
MNRESVDAYLRDGCGRCAHYQTPACKVHPWVATLSTLRELLVAEGLDEEMKWGSPCYSLDGQNVASLVSLREHCALSFFRGAALADPNAELESPGPNSRHFRYLRFTTPDQVTARRDRVIEFVRAAIALTRAGIRIAPMDEPEPVPDELTARLDGDAELRAAFDALTPGRRRSHALYVGGAKQTATRERRAEQCVPKILEGRGFNER